MSFYHRGDLCTMIRKVNMISYFMISSARDVDFAVRTFERRPVKARERVCVRSKITHQIKIKKIFQVSN
jgi:hypothetical protein